MKKFENIYVQPLQIEYYDILKTSWPAKAFNSSQLPCTVIMIWSQNSNQIILFGFAGLESLAKITRYCFAVFFAIIYTFKCCIKHFMVFLFIYLA